MEKYFLSIVSDSSEMTLSFGSFFSGYIERDLCILLRGDLGPGKTVFTRGLAQGLGFYAVRSPSFTLVHEYPTKPRLIHVDLYRIEEGLENDLVLDEFIDNGDVLVVEWPERADGLPGKNKWFFDFFQRERRNERLIRWGIEGRRAEEVIHAIVTELEDRRWAYTLE